MEITGLQNPVVKAAAELKQKKYRQQREKRSHRVSILLNDSELRALERYCERYTVSNRSRLVRETLMREILKRFEKDTPTLFD